MSAMTKKEFAILVAGVSNEWVESDVGFRDAAGNPVPIRQRGITVREYIIHIVGKFESASAFYKNLMGAAGKGIEDEKALIQALDLGKQVADQIDEQVNINQKIAALSMVPIGDYSDVPEFEKLFSRLDDTVFSKILEGAEFCTWGGDPSSFFDRVASMILESAQTKAIARS